RETLDFAESQPGKLRCAYREARSSPGAVSGASEMDCFGVTGRFANGGGCWPASRILRTGACQATAENTRNHREGTSGKTTRKGDAHQHDKKQENKIRKKSNYAMALEPRERRSGRAPGRGKVIFQKLFSAFTNS